MICYAKLKNYVDNNYHSPIYLGMLEKIIHSFGEIRQLYFRRKILAITLMGYSSGFPHVLMGAFTFWMSQAGVSLKDIGLFALTGTPFLIKFLWAPFIDGFKLPLIGSWLGRRRGWFVISQLILFGLIFTLAGLDPKEDMMLCVMIAVCMSFASATADIVIDALRVDLLDDREQGAGATMSVLGYRIAAIVASGVVMIIAGMYDWELAFTFGAFTLFLGVIGSLIISEPEEKEVLKDKKFNLETAKLWFSRYVIQPFMDFTQRSRWPLILAFIVLYKLGDAYLGAMANPFYQKIGFTPDEVGAIAKTYGMIVSIMAGFIGGYLLYKMGIYKSLLIFGILQAVTNLSFAWLANVGAETYALTIAITLDNSSGAMATAAFVAYLSGLCNLKFTATQYALLSSFASFGRTWLSSVSGHIVDAENGLGVPWD